MRTQRLLTLALGGLMASCAAPPPSKAPAGGVPAVASAPAVDASAPTAPDAQAAASQVLVTPATIQTSQRQATAAIDMLEGGNEEQATAELQRALQNDPNNKLAQLLLRQIQADPVATLGREHFQYKVQAGESISKIAQRFLGDVHQFYILARYNDLKVPKQLQSGQVIKVPGKAPPAVAAAPAPAPVKPVAVAPPPPAPAPAPTPAPSPAPAPVVAAPAAASAPVAVVDPVKVAERERVAKVASGTKAARAAYARQDLVAAIRHWDGVLELDPTNNNAKIERQRAVDLKAKLDRLK